MSVQFRHVMNIHDEYTTESSVLRSFTNLSNTVIQTALSGQSKFVFEILQNADDAYEEIHKTIDLVFCVCQDLLIVHHSGKGFDHNDVERICDYASQIEEVKANDLSKTGYKGLGFKSLFNLSDTIYIVSNGYSFRFDKTQWPNPEERPWQVIPIWCRADELPLHGTINYSYPVNFILRVKDVDELQGQLKELIDQPDLLLYLHRINNLRIILNGEDYYIQRKREQLGQFDKVSFLINCFLVSTWLIKSYESPVPPETRQYIQGASRFVYPDKIKTAKRVNITYALKCNEWLTEILNVKGLCFSTLPTQLYLTLPYHLNSFFILNLDRTQLHENEWNEFLIEAVGQLQLCLLRDLTSLAQLKNQVVSLYVRDIEHPYRSFARAFRRGLNDAKGKIPWLPSHHGQHLLRLGEAWSDDIEFFKQNFYKIRDHAIYPSLIDYNVMDRINLLQQEGEAKHFNHDNLFRDFPEKYYPQLTQKSHIEFISYLYKKFKENGRMKIKLKSFPFLLTKNKKLLPPQEAAIEESQNPIPDFSLLDPVDNQYLPEKNLAAIKQWFCDLGARRLGTPIQVIRDSILTWLDSGSGIIEERINKKNHVKIINYLAININQLNEKEIVKLREKLPVLTENNFFRSVRQCYLPDAVPVKELADIVISNDEKLSSAYDIKPDTKSLRGFFIRIGINSKLNFLEVLNRSIFEWLEKDQMKDMITKDNYRPIIDYIASHISSLDRPLPKHKRELLKDFLVLTMDETFHKAQHSYFDKAIPKIKGLQHVITKGRQVSTSDISSNLEKFLTDIGVKKTVDPLLFIRESIIKWHNEGENLSKRINRNNHHEILKYIAQNLNSIKSGLDSKPKQRNALKNIIILTQDNTFSPACKCYWPASENNEEIPGIEDIISPNELVSSDYDLKSMNLKAALEYLGVRNIQFTDIYEKYSNYLNNENNMNWFFTHLVTYWKKNGASPKSDGLLKCMRSKFKTASCLLAKNKRKYLSMNLYSSKFDTMHSIDPNSVPVLAYEALPEELEDWLGLKKELDLLCIMGLFKTVEKNPLSGQQKTLTFYKCILEQLRSKSKTEVRSCGFKLLSEENYLVLASNLYYFKEEQVKCKLEKCYLKRIVDMSHSDTLDLAELCGVNILPFKEDFNFIKETASDSLKNFYMERLPFIVIQESTELNENPSIVLKHLFEKLSVLKLYTCERITVQYPFGEPVDINTHFDDFIVYVNGNWRNFKSEIYEHMRTKLNLKTNIGTICSMDVSSNKSVLNWLNDYHNEGKKVLNRIKAELQKLLFKVENEDINKSHSLDNSTNGKYLLKESHTSALEDFVSVGSSKKLSVCEDSADDYSSSEEASVSTSSLENCDTSTGTNNRKSVEKNVIETEHLPEKTKYDAVSLIDQLGKRSSTLSDLLESMQVKKNMNAISTNNVKSEEFDNDTNSEDDEDSSSEEASLCTSSLENFDMRTGTNDRLSVEKFLPEKIRYDAVSLIDQLRERTSSSNQLENVQVNKNVNNVISTNNVKSEDFVEQIMDNDTNSEDEVALKNSTGIRNDNNNVLNTIISEQENLRLQKVRANSIGRNVLDFSSLLPQELDVIQNKAVKNQLKTSSNNSMKGTLTNESNPKRLRESYVFTLLQNYYKRKYPNSKCKSSFGHFRLQWQSRTIDIVWLNEIKDILHPYDIVLKKDGNVKQLIEVDSAEIRDNNLFILNHQNILKSIKKLPKKYEEKYCCCCVLGVENLSEVVDKIYKPVIAYKIVPVMINDIK
nr:uncharacterized protein LOC122269434 [Parasteatoda tepidariorum]